jgi:hypothetical protein
MHHLSLKPAAGQRKVDSSFNFAGAFLFNDAAGAAPIEVLKGTTNLITGTATWKVGSNGSTLRFPTGVGTYLTHTVNLPAKNLTVIARVLVDSTSGNYAIAAEESGGTVKYRWQIRGGVPAVFTPGYTQINATNSMTAGRMTHLAFTWGPDGVLKHYMDGLPNGSGTDTDTIGDLVCRIGNHGSGDEGLGGEIEMIKFYGSVLTDRAILDDSFAPYAFVDCEPDYLTWGQTASGGGGTLPVGALLRLKVGR